MKVLQTPAASFDVVWREAEPLVRAALLRTDPRFADLEDVIQITGLRAWRTDKSFESTQHFVDWCCVVARNVRIDEWRRNRRLILDLTVDVADPAHDAEELALMRVRFERMDAEVDRLPRAQRLAIRGADGTETRTGAERKALFDARRKLTSGNTGAYTLTILSADHPASWTTDTTVPTLDWAKLTASVIDANSNTVATVTGSNGTLNLGALSPSGGAYTVSVDNKSSDLTAPGLSVTYTTTTEATQGMPSTLTSTTPWTGSATAAAQGYVDANMTWAKDNHNVTQPLSDFVGWHGTQTQTINVTGTGVLSGSWSWPSTYGSMSRCNVSVSALSPSVVPINNLASGPVSGQITWPGGAVPPKLELSIIDSSGNQLATSNTGVGATSANVYYQGPLTNLSFKVVDTGTATTYNLSGDFQTITDLQFTLKNPSGTIVSQGDSSSGSYSFTRGIAHGEEGAYTAQWTSLNFNASYTGSLTVPTMDWANVTATIKDASNNVVATKTSASGAMDVSYLAPGPGSYTVTVQDNSTDLSVPLTGTVGAPVVRAPNLDLELYNPSGTKVAQATNNATAKPETLSYNVPSGAGGNYTLKVISQDFASNYTLSGSAPAAAYAPVTANLKNASGTVVATQSSTNGGIAFDYLAPAAGNYTLELKNTSPDVSVPSISGNALAPKVVRAQFSLALKNSSGTTVATGSGTHPTSLSASNIPAGSYNLVSTPLNGSGTATLTGSYPGRALKEVIGYDANDHVTSIDNGTTTDTETLSPSGRVLQRVVTDDATGATSENTLFGYADGSDSPAYSLSGGNLTTYIDGPGGLSAIVTPAGVTWQHANRHGDIFGTSDANGAWTVVPLADEFGVASSTPASRLGWLGGKERFTADSTLRLIRMGVRLYDPVLARFLEVDPIEGGSANNYDYVSADPVNRFDLAGTICWSCHWKNAKKWVNRNRWKLGGLAVAGVCAGSGGLGCGAATAALFAMQTRATGHKYGYRSMEAWRHHAWNVATDLYYAAPGLAYAKYGKALGGSRLLGQLVSAPSTLCALFRRCANAGAPY